MAEIFPFRALRYDPMLVDDLADVVTPPYDVISPGDQVRYYETHPKNVIRLILGKVFPEDDENNNRYTRAAVDFAAWQEDGTLKLDSRPAIYLLEEQYRVPGGEVKTRRGFISLVRLEEVGRGAGFILTRRRSRGRRETASGSCSQRTPISAPSSCSIRTSPGR